MSGFFMSETFTLALIVEGELLGVLNRLHYSNNH
jgi:hypothetical protein